jgi:type I restriction enzyme S subunit
MVEILWHRRETRRQTEKTKLNLKHWKKPVYSTKTISDYLNRKTTKIDQTISKIETQIDLLKEYRTALISNVVTGKIDVRT